MNRSLGRRLLLILGASIVAAWLATAFFTYLDTRRLIDDMLDAQLEQSASLLLTLLDRVPQERLDGTSLHLPAAGADRMIAYRVSVNDGGTAWKSVGDPDFPTDKWQSGFTDTVTDGGRWRVFGAADGAGRFVEVALRQEARARFADRVAVHILHPLWFAVPLLALLVWFSVRWGLKPLRAIAATVERRRADDVQPLDIRWAPSEVQPLIDALDRLLARIAALLERERRFAADAAHELRTPLAAIRTHAEVARQERDPTRCAEAIEGVIAGSDRGSRLVEQLLVLSRLDQDALTGATGPVDLRALVIDCVAEAAPGAALTGVDLGAAEAGGGETVVTGNRELLRVMIRNLIDNAVRYTPAGGEVTAAVESGGGEVVLRVVDSGPGIPAELRERVFDRFYRVEGNHRPGCGLGLSIVSRIVALHGGQVGFEDAKDKGGFTVRVTLPAPGF
ncbi:ATP-binding protein [Defluviimonas sp. SAOS-178_SWC]|uniref:ATP-binding protein n=1 Tax=Defluviimonas sp. SAOS-178_SWC TaxID=3121287 RepID=UPI0032216E00